MNIITEFSRRQVFKAALAYIVFSWLLLQIIAIIFPILSIPIVYQKWVLAILAIAFLPWLIFAYIYEWTPEGFRQTSNIKEVSKSQNSRNKRSSQYIIFALSIATILLVVDKVFNITPSMGKKTNEVKTIAVLPFAHQSVDSDDEFFTSGVHEDLMTKLASIQDFRIISKSSVMPYKDYEGDLREVGEALNVTYILQGSVRRFNKDVRLTVQLIESEANMSIWSHEYNGKLDNVFQLQAEIAAVLTDKLKANLSSSEQSEINSAPTSDLDAYDDFLKARFILNKPRNTYDEINQAIVNLEKSIDADSEFAEAWSLLIKAYSEKYTKIKLLKDKDEEAQRAKSKAENALKEAKSLAPEKWEVLRDEGIYYKNIESNLLKALTSFEKAIEQNPSDVESMQNLGEIHFRFQQLDELTSLLENAFKLTQSSGKMSYMLTFAYEFQGKYDKMIPILQRLSELYPDQKQYAIDVKYYEFLNEGSLSAFNELQEIVKNTDADNPWDERALKNKEMIVAMFNNEFDNYHDDWKGKFELHTKNHGNWLCPLVINDNLNQARMLHQHGQKEEANELLEEASTSVMKPINPNSVCMFNPEAYIPKLEFLKENHDLARQKIDQIAFQVIQNDAFPSGAVERTVFLEAVDLIIPEKVYYYYKQIVENTISMASFESICADPWTYPNLIKDEKFEEEIRKDGRFTKFLEFYGFLRAS